MRNFWTLTDEYSSRERKALQEEVTTSWTKSERHENIVTREKPQWGLEQDGEGCHLPILPFSVLPTDTQSDPIQGSIQPSLPHNMLFFEDCGVCQGLKPDLKTPKFQAFRLRKPFGSQTYYVPNLTHTSEETNRNASWELLKTTQTLK